MKFNLGLGVAAALFAVHAWLATPASALPTPGQIGRAAVTDTGDQGMVQTVASRGRMGGGSMYRAPGRSYGAYRGGGYRGAYRGGYRGAYRGGSRYYRGNRAYRAAYRGPNRYYRGGRYYNRPGVRANRAWNRRYARYPYRNRYRYGRYYPYPYWGYGVGFGYGYGYGGYDPYWYDDPYYGYGDGYGVYNDGDVAVNGDSDYIAYCSRKYRSFNPDTGMYRTYSGQWKRCVYTG